MKACNVVVGHTRYPSNCLQPFFLAFTAKSTIRGKEDCWACKHELTKVSEDDDQEESW